MAFNSDETLDQPPEYNLRGDSANGMTGSQTAGSLRNAVMQKSTGVAGGGNVFADMVNFGKKPMTQPLQTARPMTKTGPPVIGPRNSTPVPNWNGNNPSSPTPVNHPPTQNWNGNNPAGGAIPGVAQGFAATNRGPMENWNGGVAIPGVSQGLTPTNRGPVWNTNGAPMPPAAGTAPDKTHIPWTIGGPETPGQFDGNPLGPGWINEPYVPDNRWTPLSPVDAGPFAEARKQQNPGFALQANMDGSIPGLSVTTHAPNYPTTMPGTTNTLQRVPTRWTNDPATSNPFATADPSLGPTRMDESFLRSGANPSTQPPVGQPPTGYIDSPRGGGSGVLAPTPPRWTNDPASPSTPPGQTFALPPIFGGGGPQPAGTGPSVVYGGNGSTTTQNPVPNLPGGGPRIPSAPPTAGTRGATTPGSIAPPDSGYNENNRIGKRYVGGADPDAQGASGQSVQQYRWVNGKLTAIDCSGNPAQSGGGSQTATPPPSPTTGGNDPSGLPNATGTPLDLNSLNNVNVDYLDKPYQDALDAVSRKATHMGALTGAVNSGGFIPGLTEALSPIANQFAAQKGETLFKAQQANADRVLDKYKFDNAQQLEQWIAEHKMDLDKYGIDQNVLLGQFQSRNALAGAQAGANASTTAAQIGADASKYNAYLDYVNQKYGIDVNRELGQGQLGLGYYNAGNNYSLGLYGTDVTRENNMMNYLANIYGMGPEWMKWLMAGDPSQLIPGGSQGNTVTIR